MEMAGSDGYCIGVTGPTSGRGNIEGLQAISDG
jgi:hypothetical protein